MIDKFEERFKRLEETGEWWIDPWWVDTQIEFPFPPKSIDSIVEVFRRHFSAEWVKEIAKNPRPNIVFPALCIGNSLVESRLLGALGAMFLALEASPGFQQKANDLRNNKGESTYLELEAALALTQAGFSIEFPSEGKIKSPDVLAERDGLKFAVECKRLRDEMWESWEEQLTGELIQAIPNAKDGTPLTVHIALNPRLTEIRLNEEKESSLNSIFRQTILAELNAALQNEIMERSPPFTIQLNDLATIEVLFRTPDRYSSVTGVERTIPSIFRRIFQNGVLRALEQLPIDIPSVIVVYSKFELSSVFFRMFFDAACKAQPLRFSNLTAVVVCNIQTIFRASTPLIFTNRYSTHQSCANEVRQVFETFFGGISV